MFLPNRPRPWKIIRDKELGLVFVKDATGKTLAGFTYYDPAVSSLGYIMEDEAVEMAKAIAERSKEE